MLKTNTSISSNEYKRFLTSDNALKVHVYSETPFQDLQIN